MKRVISAEVVARAHAAGERRIAAPPASSVVTPEAWSRARELGVSLERDEGPGRVKARPAARRARPPPDERGSAERVVDASGVRVVRGRSVRLGRFAAAGPDTQVGLLDLITGADGSPMTAGIMSWRREDSFPWSLGYDEIDLVLEGVLHVVIEGRTLEARAGDVVHIPKGSRIVFGTPSHVRVFYVTWPADWAGSS
ncbi:MAG: DUF861 domain-containing protein [Deltaproteobacteria bacterium]|nr:DUF861 domain-containing protein [Deltaproteobacteria bacterium]